ncbi:hypothetical protein BLNAU_24115 [Blattamonas nauphoetae]|uniref:Uncharacterized protein n=1 Tax=Blattamonas nauphoetae TaxID=2049346 RepID=A0ABQ9WNT6_9EUKA|nr:hypothetical protein BLNAU_24115 [Blattamonas nauphoetae]
MWDQRTKQPTASNPASSNSILSTLAAVLWITLTHGHSLHSLHLWNRLLSPLFPTHGTEVTKSEMGFENDMGMINECDFANHELKKLVITGKTCAHCFVGEQQFVESDKDSDSLTLNGIHSL